jgi:hypothetical protein
MDIQMNVGVQEKFFCLKLAPDQLTKLHFMQARIMPVLGQKIVVIAHFPNFALIQDHDHIRLTDGREPMGDDDTGSARDQLIDGTLDQQL